MDKIIYIVTSGEYSDYRIEAVFTTEKQAVTFRNKLAIAPSRIESYVAD